MCRIKFSLRLAGLCGEGAGQGHLVGVPGSFAGVCLLLLVPAPCSFAFFFFFFWSRTRVYF